MSADPKSIHQENLAFMKALAQGGEVNQRAAGELFVWGGVVYGLQTLGYFLSAMNWIALEGAAINTIVGVAPTVIFLAALAWVLWRDRKAKPGGVTQRAFDATFGAAGLANMAMIIVFGVRAAREQSLTVWLLYPCVVFALQGAAWYVAYMLRRKGWMGLVAAGWFATAIGMGLTIGTPTYALIATIALLGLMAGSGLALMRRKPAP